MAIPVYAGRGAQVSSANAITPTPHAGHAADDIDILPVMTENQTATLSVAAGFALLTTTVGQGPAGISASVVHTIFWRRWNGTDGNPTIADSGAIQMTSMMSFTGCITSGDPWDVFALSQQTSATTAGSASGLTTTVADCLVALFTAGGLPNTSTNTEFSGWTNSDLASITEDNDRTRDIGGADGGAYGACSGGKAVAGSVGATTFTAVTSALRDHVVIAFKGPAGGGIDSQAKRYAMINFGDGTTRHMLMPPVNGVPLADMQHLLDCAINPVFNDISGAPDVGIIPLIMHHRKLLRAS